jgi:hypothetical protein
MTGVRFNFTLNGWVRADVAAGHQAWRNHELPIRMARIMAGAQLFKWLSLDGSARFYPRAPYYDSVDPYAGREKSFNIGATFQPNDRVRQQVSFDRDLFDRLSGGGRVYAANILNSRTTYQFDKRFSVRGILRYNGFQKRILADLLAAFEPVPGTVAYAGYGGLYERRGWDDREWLPGQGDYLNTRRGLFFKLSYLYRF